MKPSHTALLTLSLFVSIAPAMAQEPSPSSSTTMDSQEFHAQREKLLARMKGATPRSPAAATDEETPTAHESTYGRGYDARQENRENTARPTIDRNMSDRPARPQFDRPGRP